MNIYTEEFEYDDGDPPGYHGGVLRIGKMAGGEELSVKVYELPPGESLCPYHYEYLEEWLIVLDGTIVLRTPEGERELERGAAVCFPAGPAGAHKTSNRGEQPARMLMFSSAREPAIAVYPDSDKLGVYITDSPDDTMFRRSDGGVDYWEGER